MSLQFFSFRFAIYCLTHFQTGSLLPLSFILRVFFPLFLDLLSPPLTFLTTPSFLFQSTPHLLHLSFFQAFCFSLFHLSFFQAFSFPCFLFYIYPLAILSSPLFSFISLLFYLSVLSVLLLYCALKLLFFLMFPHFSVSSLFSVVPSAPLPTFALPLSPMLSLFSFLQCPFSPLFLSRSISHSSLCLFWSLLCARRFLSFFPPFSPHFSFPLSLPSLPILFFLPSS